MKKSNILREAKKVLARNIYEIDNGKRTFICHAIEWVRQSRPELIRHDTYELREHIQKQLGLYSTVDGWLEKIAGVPRRQLTPENLQLYRHRWLDHLILHFEARGD